jgi:hypothetical protein
METNGLTQKEIIQDCKEACDFGYEYRASLDRNLTCCGECVALGCVVDGALKKDKESWYSDDGCSMISCTTFNGSVIVCIVYEECS